MNVRTKLGNLPIRVATGAFILNSGLGKRSANEQMAHGIHGMAKQAYPFLDKLSPEQFTQLLSSVEIALGTALLAPIVPEWLSGLGLTAFSGGLVGLYLKTPGAREGTSVRPSREGIVLAKDVWMLGIGLSLLFDSLLTHRSDND